MLQSIVTGGPGGDKERTFAITAAPFHQTIVLERRLAIDSATFEN
jgi:hypothetical protein